jgi:flagellar motor switch protein FliG
LTVDTDHYLRTVLTEALGEEKAGPFIDRILISDKDHGLNRLKWLDGRLVADLIRNEHPQIIATILIHLDAEQAAEVVSFLLPEKRSEVVLRMCSIDSIKPEAISQLGAVIEKQLQGQRMGNTATVGGIKNVADIINYLDGGVDTEVLDKIKQWDDDLYEKICDKMFIFENLIEMDDRGLQTLLRDVPPEQLLLALKGATDSMRDKIFNNMSKRAADLMRDDLAAQGPVKVSEVEQAQKDVLTVARKLAEEGKISLGSKGGEEMI